MSLTPTASAEHAQQPHPLDPSTASELTEAVKIIQERFPNQQLFFHAGGLAEPPKVVLRKFLRAERAGQKVTPPPRCIDLMFYIAKTPRLFEATVNVTEKKVEKVDELPRSKMAPLNPEECNTICDLIYKSEELKKEAERLNVPLDHIVAEPWDLARDADGEIDRKAQVFMFLRDPNNNDLDSNPYAHPLDFLAIVDLNGEQDKIASMPRLPLGVRADGKDEPKDGFKLGSAAEPEYAHHLQKSKPRTSLKPLRVVQPEGPSFHLDGNLIHWEKWRFRIGFNWREGLVLYDITFDGREVFHRISLSEMVVPYGDPRAPLHRKSAFDLGNLGAGFCANNLGLGCDCLGVIKYFDADLLGFDGKPYKSENVVCMHEIDAGIQWKHTNWRTGNASVVRRRQLQLQTIITVANYEYCFYYNFDQSGEIAFDVLATGILSTTPVDPDNKEPCEFGTRVGYGVLGPYHQHIFNLRIDPCIDGDGNSLQVVDSVPMPLDENNPHGIGYKTESRIVKQSGTEESDIAKGRAFKIINPNKINPTSLQPVGYKLSTINSQKILAHPSSWHARRSQFGEHPIWVTKYRDGELFASGTYTNQSEGDDGLKYWVERKDNVENDDIVVWHSFSFTHNPRPEDFPVMPAEVARVMLKPNSFFEYNPTLDVPPSSQLFNQSILYENAKKEDALQSATKGMSETSVKDDKCCNSRL
ncbi:primary-amine oxidase [Malassezia psittaci]|uniref:Amine oxidase n=1 Tax=Malassezia psittaci TaxID=1821823 RepID=A0AAF0FFT9_9BASI|nr:primary-amine oxidase [Malassezia psittaci]